MDRVVAAGFPGAACGVSGQAARQTMEDPARKPMIGKMGRYFDFMDVDYSEIRMKLLGVLSYPPAPNGVVADDPCVSHVG